MIRVGVIPGDHDYPRALYDAMPPGEIDERPMVQHVPLDDPASQAAEYAAQAGDILHVGWPEHLFTGGDRPPDEHLCNCLAFVAALDPWPGRVVWTMHNRQPHGGMWREEGRGPALYRAWAARADGVIHHSRWGMELMRAELPYRPGARHVVLPHGHFGAQMPARTPRAELETAFGLEPCEVRFGVVGRPQQEKQVETIVRGFQAGARPGQQLFVTAATPELAAEAGGDPRIALRPRERWLSREEIAAQVYVCDALVSAHTGFTYLTSGITADAVGAGLAMLVPDWEYFRETLGDAAFYHDNTAAGLARLFATLDAGDIARGKARSAVLREASAWPRIAAGTLELLRAVEGRSAGSVGPGRREGAGRRRERV